MEKPQARKPFVFALQLEDPHAGEDFVVRGPFVASQHRYSMTASDQPAGHERLLPLDASDVAGGDSGHLTIRRMCNETDMSGTRHARVGAPWRATARLVPEWRIMK
jgi:hypothetical protein